ncbi:type I restriction-modification system subunit M [Mycoplasma wenyonii]|uniref:type I restriction-modification system subunit M n=1 Tax=Mycoplasma wenyonii TaxID=65123 RepID=UPI0005C61859|nr:type I restriction-modification system subunit M [Mycoplasma wenyonii]
MANELRNRVDNWDFKEYVLGFLFYRCISEKLRNEINENERKNNPNFNYASLKDEEVPEGMKELLRTEKGYFILPSDLFENVLESFKKSRDNAQERLKKAFDNISYSARGGSNESNFQGLFSIIQLNNNWKLGETVDQKNKTIAKILEGINDMRAPKGDQEDFDLFGVAYEDLIHNYASDAKKKGGDFFTPAEVSELLAELALNNRTKINKVYDPACGSGALLLKFLEAIKKRGGHLKKICGQEVNATTHKLCVMNMFLRNINYSNFNIIFGDTLLSPVAKEHMDTDAIISNPPYSAGWKGSDDPEIIADRRYAVAGALAPRSKSDLAFVMHSCHCLRNSGGIAAIVLFPGVFYRQGSEQKIRQYLLDNNFVDSIIALAGNLFYGTSIETCILVLKKGRQETDVLFIDARNEFLKVKKKNRLTSENIKKILNVYFKREEIPLFSRLVSYEEIKEQEYNLSINKYIFPEEEKEGINIAKVNQEMAFAEEEIRVLKENLNKVITEIKEYLQNNDQSEKDVEIPEF